MQITLRGLRPELAQRIQQLALEEHLSLNKAALKVLAKGAGLTVGRKTVIGQDLDHLFGTWKESDADNSSTRSSPANRSMRISGNATAPQYERLCCPEKRRSEGRRPRTLLRAPLYFSRCVGGTVLRIA